MIVFIAESITWLFIAKHVDMYRGQVTYKVILYGECGPYCWHAYGVYELM